MRFRRFAIRAMLSGGLWLSTQASAGTPVRIGFSGFGTIRMGMSLWELLVALGEHTTVENIERGCTSVYVTGSADVVYMVIDDALARVEVRTPSLPTLSGIKVGDTERDIFVAYAGRVVVSDHEYQEGHYLAVYSTDRRSAVVFDTDGNRIRSFRIGRLPEALHVEGCS